MILWAVVDAKTHKRIAQFFNEEDAIWFAEHPPDHYNELIVQAFGSIG